MRILLAVVLVPAIASAQPEPVVAPNLYGTGNLRIEMACADYSVTPDQGLAVSVDGRTVNALRINGEYGTSYDENNDPIATTWAMTDVGYLVQPGPHHITVAAPGCATDQTDVIAAADHSEVISGRLAISDPDLLGAPNGGGVTLALITGLAPRGEGSKTELDTTSYAYDPTGPAYGGLMSFSYERRSFVLAFDTSFSVGPLSGTATTPDSHFGPSTFSFTGSTYRLAQAIRFGKRVALRDIAFSGGTGIGVQGWLASTSSTPPATSYQPDGPDGSWYVPVWLAATIKPACNWGFQALAEYDIHPTATDTSGSAFAFGWIYQPSDACSEPPSLRVGPNV
jgi:hypothetical protein